MATLVLALRVAYRQARRYRLRTLAIVATLVLPVTVATALDVVARSNNLSTRERLDRQLGGAQAVISWQGSSGPDAAILQAPDPQNGSGPASFPSGGGSNTGSGGAAPEQAAPSTGPLSARDSLIEELDGYPFVAGPKGGGTVAIRGMNVATPALSSLFALISGRPATRLNEVDLSPFLATSLGAGVGDKLSVPTAHAVLSVVGIIKTKASPHDQTGFSTVATVRRLTRLGGNGITGPTGDYFKYFVVGPSSVGWQQVMGLNAHGWVVTSRAVVLHPPARSMVQFYDHFGSQMTTAAGAGAVSRNEIVSLLAAMALIEVVLLAGPAFAVGIRRRRYELALLSASGAGRSQLVAVVAADGLLLGCGAALIGVVGGVGLGAISLAALAHLRSVLPGEVKVRAADIGAIAALAVLSGLVAALIPAVAATRTDLSSVLRGRLVIARLSRRGAVGGFVVLVAAAILALGNLRSAGLSSVVSLVLAAALAEVGLALVTPAVLAFLGRFGRRLPVWSRLALRDASRNRSAAAPAVAAIVAVVAASATGLVYGASWSAHMRAAYQPTVAIGSAISPLNSSARVAALALVRVKRDLGAGTVLELNGVAYCFRPTRTCQQFVIVPPTAPGCPPIHYSFPNGEVGSSFVSSTGLSSGAPVSVCVAVSPAGGSMSSVLVSDGHDMASVLGGSAPARAAEVALRAGSAVVFDSAEISNGRVTISAGPVRPIQVRFRAIAINRSLSPAMIIMPKFMAARLGLEVQKAAIVVQDASRLPVKAVAAADRDLEHLGIAGLQIETGYHDPATAILLAVAGADILLMLGAAVAATALISADSRADLTTLGALGATVSGRRRLSMARAGIICAVGALLGTAAGVVPGVGLVWRVRSQFPVDLFGSTGSNGYPLTIPWLDLLLVVVAAPIVAALAAAVIAPPFEGPRRRLAG